MRRVVIILFPGRRFSRRAGTFIVKRNVIIVLWCRRVWKFKIVDWCSIMKCNCLWGYDVCIKWMVWTKISPRLGPNVVISKWSQVSL